MDRTPRDLVPVFAVALLGRRVAVAVTTVTSLNPYATADAHGFAASADRIATTLARGTVPVLDGQDIYDVWGALLSPFWLVPGPNRLYGRVVIALLGALAVYNVYIVVRHHWSRRAALLAVAPMCVYPSFLFIHATVLREAAVLFGLTTVTRLLLAPAEDLGTVTKYAVSVAILVPVVYLRPENLAVYALVLAVAAFVAIRPWRRTPHLTRYATVGGAFGGSVFVLAYGQRVLSRLTALRLRRARGRTEYLGGVLPDTLPVAVAFSWIGALYFLFSPFPWMVEQLSDFVVAFEGLVSLVYGIFAVRGAPLLATRTLPGAAAFAVGLVVGATFYGLGTVNVGTAVRHRQMLLWVLFVFGGIGMAASLRGEPQ